VCGDAGFLQEAAARARGIVVPRFDWAVVAAAYEEVYRSIGV
jgi:hypothetical protein